MSAAVEIDWSTFEVTAPSVVHGMPNDVYHADPVVGGSLSCSGAKTLLPPSCPAIFKWQRDHGRPDKRVFDFGHAAHDRVLGGGPPIVVVPDEITAKDGAWSTKEAKAFVAEVRARGAVPIRPDDNTVIDAMADALRKHPVAARLLSPDNGEAEVSLFWTDERTGINRRARLDLLPNGRAGRMIVADYKTAPSAERSRFAKDAANFHYDMQGPYYSDGVKALGLADDVAFLFVVQEKTAPYLVNVIQLDVVADRIGAALNRQAIDIYAECIRTGNWSSYSDDVELVSLPRWYESTHEGDIA